MATLLGWFFKILGFIFFLLILGGIYAYGANLYGIRDIALLLTSPAASNERMQEAVPERNKTEPVQKDSHPILSESQEAAFENVGINPATLPSSVTDTQKTCLINAVGEARANEIKAGALPTVTELLKAKSCF